MTIDTIAFLAFVFVATASTVAAHRRRQDVLYGPYIKGDADMAETGRDHAAVLLENCHYFVAKARLVVERKASRLHWKARKVMYVASVFVC